MECPVCLDVYKTPLLLPGCGHTLCAECADLLLAPGNYLRCPECRLVYQLKQGVKSLPRNVALQRTIDETSQKSNRVNPMCAEHPDDAVALYCKTCEKSICLKCYFTNTLRRGETSHSGHQVDTTEDAFSKEKRLLDEKCRECETKLENERKYREELEKIEERLQKILDIKLEEIEKKKSDIINQAKQTSGKLKFTLKGSIARETEYLQMTMESSGERMAALEKAAESARETISKASREEVEINTLKEARSLLSDVPALNDRDRPEIERFLKVENFDTDLEPCLSDPKKALSYQTDVPRQPSFLEEECIISTEVASIALIYNEIIRVKKITVYYKDAMYKGMSEKQWQEAEVTDLAKGQGRLVLQRLERGTLYRMYALASNDFGDSIKSKELWFRTTDSDVEMRIT